MQLELNRDMAPEHAPLLVAAGAVIIKEEGDTSEANNTGGKGPAVPMGGGVVPAFFKRVPQPGHQGCLATVRGTSNK